MPNPNAVLKVLNMSEHQMMAVEVIVLYQAFYALPTRVSPALCDLSSGKGLEQLNEAEREVAERIVRVVQKRCPAPTTERWKNWQAPAANDDVYHKPRLRITYY
jgi:hypothetical protein